MISDFFTDNVDCFCVPGWALVQESDEVCGPEMKTPVQKYYVIPLPKPPYTLSFYEKHLGPRCFLRFSWFEGQNIFKRRKDI
jgi:hypothetical protein